MTLLLLIILPIVTFILGCMFGSKMESSSKTEENEKIDPSKRRGIYKHSLSHTNGYGTKKDFDVDYEILELEKTSTKSKIKVISYTTNSSEFNMKGTFKEKVIDMVEGKWMESNKIEWIEDLDKLKRKEKLDNILK